MSIGKYWRSGVVFRRCCYWLLGNVFVDFILAGSFAWYNYHGVMWMKEERDLREERVSAE